MQLNKTLIALALGLAMSECSKDEKKDKRPEDPNQLTTRERVELAAVAPYSLYMAPIAFADASLSAEGPRRARALTDLTLELDNAKVPTHRDELNFEQAKALRRAAECLSPFS